MIEPFRGGQEALTATLIRELRKRGHRIWLFACEGTDPALADELHPYPGLPELSMIAALDPQLPEPDFLADHHALVAAWSVLHRETTAFDIIHNQTLHHLPLSLSPALQTPLVTTLHTPPFPWLELGAAVAAPTAHYVSVSEALRGQWTTITAHHDVIHNGIDPATFALGPGGNDLAWVGRLVPEKAPELAVRAARAARRPLRLAGPIPDRSWFDATVAPLLSGEIEYLGHLRDSETAELMGSSGALLVTPRWEEPFGMVAVEAALTGTPVVGVRRGGLPEVVQPEIGVLVDPGGTDDEVARRLAGGVELVGQLPREEVRAAAAQRFSADRMATEYERLFHHLTAHP